MSPRIGNPSGGEPIDKAAGEAVRLAYRALDRFPDVVRRHKFVAGGAVVSSSLVVLAGVAIARRIRGGQTPEEAVAAVTEEEVQGLRIVEPEPEAALERDGADSPPASEEPESELDTTTEDSATEDSSEEPGVARQFA
jgi:hypothetical protein